MKFINFLAVCFVLSGAGTLSAQQPAKSHCTCKDCNCSVEQNCGCYSGRGCACSPGQPCSSSPYFKGQ